MTKYFINDRSAIEEGDVIFFTGSDYENIAAYLMQQDFDFFDRRILNQTLYRTTNINRDGERIRVDLTRIYNGQEHTNGEKHRDVFTQYPLEKKHKFLVIKNPGKVEKEANNHKRIISKIKYLNERYELRRKQGAMSRMQEDRS